MHAVVRASTFSPGREDLYPSHPGVLRLLGAGGRVFKSRRPDHERFTVRCLLFTVHRSIESVERFACDVLCYPLLL